MCTLTWKRKSVSDLTVYFNRDELKIRPVADPPARFESQGRSFLSPRDPKGGGTWMLANDRGLVICLLNRWELEERILSSPKSRGRLVWGLADAETPDEVASRLVNLQDYQAFTLIAFSPKGDRGWEWDGASLVAGQVPPMLTSSSFRFEEVKEAREGSFAEGMEGERFHASADEEASAYSVRMNRPDAQTWSRSIVQVTDRISWRYLAECPDLAGAPEETLVTLNLR